MAASTLRVAMALALAAALLAMPAMTGPAVAQDPAQEPAPDIEEQALAIERQLLCPQCTSKRLDICELKICEDMRALIRERLEAGDAPDEIVRFFAARYGDRVLADLPRSGFNLLLFGWVAGAMALALLGGGTMLIRMRRASTPAAGDPLGDAEERWIDRQVSGDGERR